MLQLRIFGASPVIASVSRQLDAVPGSAHVILTADGASGKSLVTADLDEDAVDPALAEVQRLGVPDKDVMLLRLDAIGPAAAQRPLASVMWADLLSQAGANARPFARYLVFMAAAGVIAAFGVIYANSTLIVGAMAISPDLLPITAAATALALRRWALTGRALTTLSVGLGCAAIVAGVMTFVLNGLNLLPTGLEPNQTGFLDGLVTVNISTPLVALAAGIAGMLALETRASSSVGVAISVTTIPASAMLGVAAGLGKGDQALGAIGVLGVNVAMMLVGGSLTLIAQRAIARRQTVSG